MIGGFAGLTKFAPLGLAPLLWRGVGDASADTRQTLAFVVAYALAILVPMLPVLLSGDWHWFWHDSIAYQASRPAPFSIWGLWGGYNQALHLPEHIVLGRGGCARPGGAVLATRRAHDRRGGGARRRRS